jgi:nitrite reductase/ring-hydroxylating ferredoxin subunit
MVDGETIVCLLHARRVDLATGRCTDSEACVRVYAAFEVNGRITVVLDGDG